MFCFACRVINMVFAYRMLLTKINNTHGGEGGGRVRTRSISGREGDIAHYVVVGVLKRGGCFFFLRHRSVCCFT